MHVLDLQTAAAKPVQTSLNELSPNVSLQLAAGQAVLEAQRLFEASHYAAQAQRSPFTASKESASGGSPL
jgi:hypothetical protein